jgi:transposase-like protein
MSASQARKQVLAALRHAALRHAASDEQAAVEYVEILRWGESGPCCPRCGSVEVKRVIGKDGQREKAMRWRCKPCARQYSVRTGTVYQESRLPMRVWAHACWRCCASKKGVSALQISRECGIGYRAALFLLNRIRFAMVEHHDAPTLTGDCEADEAYFGGKPRRRNNEATGTPGLKRGPKGNLAPVLGVVRRGGKLRLRHVTKVTAKTLQTFVSGNVRESARLLTDDNPKYVKLGRRYAGGHETVNHSLKEYARGDVNTNSIESAFAIMKRSVYGVYHALSQEHLHRYLAEWQFRYNTRKVDDTERVRLAIKAGTGKRLLYRDQPPRARAA